MRMVISNPKKNEGDAYLESMPTGFRFKPNDVELCYYLSSKIEGKRLPPNKINVVDLYDYDPMTLTAISDNESFNGRVSEWYFFTPRDKKYPGGIRPRRGARDGFWKATGVDERIYKNSKGRNSLVVGLKKTLVYYIGKQSNGVKTDWIMHEYVLGNGDPPPRIRSTGPNDMRLNEWVLCRIYDRGAKKKKKQKSTEIVKSETTLLVTNQNQEENSMANTDQGVDQQYVSPSSSSYSFPPLESQHFEARDDYLNMVGDQQTNSQMGLNSDGAFVDDSTTLTQYPRPYDHELIVDNGCMSGTFPCYDPNPMPDYSSLVPLPTDPVSSIPLNDDEELRILWDDVDYYNNNNLNDIMNETSSVPNYGNGSLISTETPPPMSWDDQFGYVEYDHDTTPASNYASLPSIPMNDQSHRVDNDNLFNIHQTEVNYGSFISTAVPSDDKQT